MTLWIKLALIAAVIALTGFAVHWYNQGIRDTQQKLDQAKYDQALLNAQTDAKMQTDAWIAKMKEKDNVTTEEIRKRDIRYAGVVSANDKLRNDLANYASGAAQLTAPTCSEGIKALSSVLGQCLDEYSEMGKHAEGHLLDSEDCRAKWPAIKGD